MGNSCHFCISSHGQVSSNEIESVSRKSNLDVMKSIILIQKHWRAYHERKSLKNYERVSNDGKNDQDE
jgi:hypothetical protein